MRVFWTKRGATWTTTVDIYFWFMDTESWSGRMEENTKEHISVKTNIEFVCLFIYFFIYFYIISIFLKRFDYVWNFNCRYRRKL